MGRIIGIDYGAKRTGIAVTDSLQIICSPLTSISSLELLSFLIKYCDEEKVEKLVIGYPSHKDGSKTYLCDEIDEVIEKIKKAVNNLQIIKIDESFSSMEGKQLMLQSMKSKKKRQEKGNLDMFSAVVILRRYLEEN